MLAVLVEMSKNKKTIIFHIILMTLSWDVLLCSLCQLIQIKIINFKQLPTTNEKGRWDIIYLLPVFMQMLRLC